MQEKVIKNLENTKNIDNLLQEFNNPIDERKIIDYNQFSINDIINESVDNAINEVITKTIISRGISINSKNVNEVAKSCKDFFQDLNFGTFEYMKKTGRSSFKVKHTMGSNGTKFVRMFFERIFNSCLKDYSFHIISDRSHVCVIFR